MPRKAAMFKTPLTLVFYVIQTQKQWTTFYSIVISLDVFGVFFKHNLNFQSLPHSPQSFGLLGFHLWKRARVLSWTFFLEQFSGIFGLKEAIIFLTIKFFLQFLLCLKLFTCDLFRFLQLETSLPVTIQNIKCFLNFLSARLADFATNTSPQLRSDLVLPD